MYGEINFHEALIRFLDFVLIALNVAAWIVTDLQAERLPKEQGPKINNWNPRSKI